MSRILRFGIPVAVVATAIAAGALFVAQPWQGEEAAAQTITYRLCNVAVQGPPPPKLGVPDQPYQPGEIHIGGFFNHADGFGQGTLRIQLQERRLVPASDVDPGIDPSKLPPGANGMLAEMPSVSVDAVTGVLRTTPWATAADRALLEPVLATLRVEPFDPTTAPWPYTDTVQVPARSFTEGDIQYRLPDPGAGLTLGSMYSRPTTPVDDYGFVILDSCRSRMYVGMQTGKVLQDERFTIIHPDDAAAFQRFLAEVKVVK